MAASLVQKVLSPGKSPPVPPQPPLPGGGGGNQPAATVVKLKVAGMLCMENCGFSVEKVGYMCFDCAISALSFPLS